MDKLKKELRVKLAENPDVTILRERVWQLPFVCYAVRYGRVKRMKMDILMKMLLFAFQETEIRRAATLSEMLFVEELFIRDSIEKMQRTQLIQLGKKGYQLTPKGHGYLEKGIFEEEVEAEETQVSFSAVHDAYWLTEGERDEVESAELPIYRYAVEGDADPDRIFDLVATEKNETEEEFQLLVSEIITCEESSPGYTTCIEFQLYDRKQDIFYARVWNLMAGRWDDILEKQIEEREVVEWREAMAKNTAEAE